MVGTDDAPAPLTLPRTPDDGSTPRTGRPPSAFRLRRRPGHLGPVNVVQLILLELMVIATLVALGRSTAVLATGIGLAVVILVVTFGRWQGRWWVECGLLRWRYRQRSRSARLAAADHRLAPLHDLVPNLTVQTVDGPEDVPVGVGADGTGWFAIVAVEPSDGVRPAPASIPLDLLSRAVRDVEQPGAVVQVVTHTVPAPTTTDGGPPCDASYSELLAPLGGAAPADQVTWVAVRLDARAVAEATLGGPATTPPKESTQVPAALMTVVRRVDKALRRSGCPTQILDADGLLDALVRSVDLDPHEKVEWAEGREEWRAWRSASLMHACFWLRGWPAADETSTLLARLAVTPGAFTSIATVLDPVSADAAPDTAEVRCLVRVAASEAALPDSCARLTQTAADAGAVLFRLDGEQAPAVYASAPTGGGAP
jgi:type VII secretion protein EccE